MSHFILFCLLKFPLSSPLPSSCLFSFCTLFSPLLISFIFLNSCQFSYCLISPPSSLLMSQLIGIASSSSALLISFSPLVSSYLFTSFHSSSLSHPVSLSLLILSPFSYSLILYTHHLYYLVSHCLPLLSYFSTDLVFFLLLLSHITLFGLVSSPLFVSSLHLSLLPLSRFIQIYSQIVLSPSVSPHVISLFSHRILSPLFSYCFTSRSCSHQLCSGSVVLAQCLRLGTDDRNTGMMRK